MKKFDMSAVTRTVKKMEFKLKYHSPEILIAVGVVGTVASAVMACRATTKLGGILDESKDTIDKIKHYTENPEELPEEYTEQDGKKDLTIVYVQTGLKVAKLYAPAVILGGLSLAGIIGSHRILTKRNVALAAAYTAVDKGFKEYRGRVVERFGEKLDKELLYNIKAEEIEETVTNENGEEETTKKTVDVINDPTPSPYARVWHEGNMGWSKDPGTNMLVLKSQQAYANEKLKADGYLMLNDVYGMLGFPRVEIGQMVGWIYDEKCPNGDNYVDFGIHYDIDEAKANFINGEERSILLDFNVDGYIADKI